MKILDVPNDILALIAMADGATAAEWGPLEDISHSLLPVTPFDPSILPDALRPWVEDIAHRMQCPIDYVAVAAMVVMSSIVGTACAIRPKQKDNWMEVPNLWGAVVGRPGRLKSPALSAAMAPIHALGREAQADFNSAAKAYEVELSTRKFKFKIKSKAIEKKGAEPSEEELSELAALSDTAIDPPVLRRYLTNDSTVEMLGEILKDSPRGLMVFRDELMGLLEGFERTGREGERQFYLEAWNGTHPFQVDRIGRGHISIPRLCASLFGGIQPDKLENYIYTMQSQGNDGFIQRFQMLAYPDEIDTLKIVDETPDEAAKTEAQQIAEVLAHCDYRRLGAQSDGPDSIPFLRFEAKRAQPVFMKWLVALDQRIRTEDSPLMQEHLGKYRKLVPVLALVTHLVDRVSGRVKGNSQVTLRSLQRAISWATYLETHARRVYALGTDHRILAAQALAKKIQAGQLDDGFTDRDVYIKGWSLLSDVDEVKAACGELEAANWIKRIKSSAKVPGRPPAPKYEINPAAKAKSNARGAPTKQTKLKR